MILLYTAAIILGAQKNVDSLPKGHASALANYLKANQAMQFVSEKEFDAASLKELRMHFGKKLSPYYMSGDLNRDGFGDFAMLLSRSGGPVQRDEDLAPEHQNRFFFRLVVWNGGKKGYRVAYEKGMIVPLVTFLAPVQEKRRRLQCAVMETDQVFILTPAGKGYIAEYYAD